MIYIIFVSITNQTIKAKSIFFTPSPKYTLPKILVFSLWKA